MGVPLKRPCWTWCHWQTPNWTPHDSRLAVTQVMYGHRKISPKNGCRHRYTSFKRFETIPELKWPCWLGDRGKMISVLLGPSPWENVANPKHHRQTVMMMFWLFWSSLQVTTSSTTAAFPFEIFIPGPKKAAVLHVPGTFIFWRPSVQPRITWLTCAPTGDPSGSFLK